MAMRNKNRQTPLSSQELQDQRRQNVQPPEQPARQEQTGQQAGQAAQFGDVGRQPTNEEQMVRRQSAPQQTMLEAGAQMDLRNLQNALMMENQGMSAGTGAVDGFRALDAPIGKEALHKAMTTLQKYKSGKAHLEQNIVENMQWYRLRHWQTLRRDNKTTRKSQVEPASGWLFNCIANKHADAMDAFPSPNVLPREESDRQEAKTLSSVLPVILDMNDFEKTYDEVWNYKLITGTGAYGLFWDSSKLNGLGDISITKIDLLNCFWEPGITDIQKSRNFFHVQLADNDTLIQQYPQLEGHLGGTLIDITQYAHDESIDTSEKSLVIDWYYKKANRDGRTVLHYCKYVNDVVLFASENDPNFADRGFYDHGKYPFIFDPLFKIEGMPTGFGYVDIGKSAQEYIDRGNQAIMQNMLSNTRPRHFIRSDGAVKEEEYADMTKDFVHVDGNLGQDSILPIQGKPLPEIYVSVINNKIDELKETTGNRDIATGGTTSGVTAASAIAAMQEAGSKLSRDANKASYRVYREICLMCIELIRQFYDMPRYFRIIGESGAMQFVPFDNKGLLPVSQGMAFGVDMGMRIPMFDIEITAQKQSPYSKLSQNELALQFYSAGFFNPQMADQALACLDMMDFDRKEFVMQKVQQNGGMLEQMVMLAQMLDDATGSGGVFSQNIAAQYGLPYTRPVRGASRAAASGAMGGEAEQEESSITKNARTRVADSTAPR